MKVEVKVRFHLKCRIFIIHKANEDRDVFPKQQLLLALCHFVFSFLSCRTLPGI